jgi:hypothetical protein
MGRILRRCASGPDFFRSGFRARNRLDQDQRYQEQSTDHYGAYPPARVCSPLACLSSNSKNQLVGRLVLAAICTIAQRYFFFEFGPSPPPETTLRLNWVLVISTARRAIPATASCVTEKSPASSSQATPILAVQDIGHAPPEALVDCDTACRCIQKRAGIVGAIGTESGHFTGKSVVNLSRHGTADNGDPTQSSILIMSSVMPKRPDRHVVMPMVSLDEGKCLLLRYRTKLRHRYASFVVVCPEYLI